MISRFQMKQTHLTTQALGIGPKAQTVTVPAFVASTILSIMTRGKATKERVVTGWNRIDQLKIKQQTYQPTNKPKPKHTSLSHIRLKSK